MLSRIVGVTIYATSTVLAAFMAGLAIGSFLLGRFIDRRDDHLRVYAVLELAIGLAALMIPLLLSLAVPLYQQLAGESYLYAAVVRAAVCFLALIVPTTMMGGTLPVLTACMVKREGLFGRNLAILYGLNTFGAVTGILLSGFVTIGAVGEMATILIGVCINLAAAAIAYWIFRREEERDRGAETSGRVPSSVQRRISPYGDAVRRFVLIAFAVNGFSALAYEVVWTRQLILFLKTSIYAFSGMLAVFLIGIASGSVFMNRFVDKLKAPIVVFGLLEVCVGFLSIVSLYLFSPLDGASARQLFGWPWALWATVIIVLPITFVFGLIFPTAGTCYAKAEEKSGSSVGWLYASNTIGSIFGSLLAGFLLIPWLGSTNTVVLLAVVNVALGLVLLLLEKGMPIQQKAACWLALPLLVVLAQDAVGRDPFLFTIENRIRTLAEQPSPWRARAPGSYDIHFNKEGIEGTVSVFSVGGVKKLWVNGIGMTHLSTASKLMSHLPLLFAQNPKRILIICFGMGTATKSAVRHPELEVTTVELVPETYEAYPYYHPDAREVLSGAHVDTIVNDGRNYLLLSDRKFDVITVDPSPPIWSAGTVNLYSKEFFELARSRLTPNGVLCLWFPGGTRDEVQSLLKTFHHVFPSTSVWSGPEGWGYYLIGVMGDTSWERFQERAKRLFENPEIREDLAEYDQGQLTLERLYRLLLWPESEVEEVAREGVLITDDKPYTEFPLWRDLLKGREEWRPHARLGFGDGTRTRRPSRRGRGE
jgi:spermidine synthase